MTYSWKVELSDISSSIWVAASAGSGKTTILIGRLLCLILNDVDPSKIVCLTYTKTGAQEMKERIYESLSRWVTLDEEKLANEIRQISATTVVSSELLKRARNLFAKVIDNVDNLKIFTIHAFCQQLLSRFPMEAGIAHNFEVIDESKSLDLIRESIENLLNSWEIDHDIYKSLKLLIFEKNEEDFYGFINYLVSKRKNFELMEKFDYKNELRKILNIDDSDENRLIDQFNSRDRSSLLQLCDVLVKHSEGDRERREDEERLQKIVEFIANANSRESYLDIFLTKKLKRRSLGSKFLKRLDNLLGTEKNIYIEEQEACYNFIQNLENVRNYNLTMAAIDVTLGIVRNYRKLKWERGLVDFDDLIITTLELLKNTEHSAWIGYKLDGEIEHILIDEAQDTSTLQWKIVESLADDFFTGIGSSKNPRSLFVVGDEKQSIFKFQDANPGMFSEKYHFYKNLIENCGGKLHRLNLRQSFRSVPTILSFVDEVFRDQKNAKKISAMDSTIEHHSSREGAGLVELWPLVDAETDEKESWKINFDNDAEVKKQEILARCIVEKIVALVQSDRVIVDRDGNYRKIAYGDIMILMRSRSRVFLSYLIKSLNRYGIPNSGLDRLNLFDHIVVQDFISLFTFILFQNDDLSLANIVKSPFLDMNEDDLYKICRYRTKNKITLFEALRDNFVEKYELLRRIIDKGYTLGIYEFCFYLLEECGFRAKILSRFNFDVNDILNKFLLFVQKYEDNNNSSLLSFVHFTANSKIEIKKDLEFNSTNYVRIMTIHASKGLQAPIVFIADSNSGVDLAREKIFWIDSGRGYEQPLYKTNSSTDILDEIRNSSEEELYSEYLRLFYVAITRAENELYLCGLAGRQVATNTDSEETARSTWYSISKLALDRLGAKEEEFEFYRSANNKNYKKFIYGEITKNKVQDNIICPEKDTEETGRVNEILGNMKKYTPTKPMKKVIFPSKFFSYRDRDTISAENHRDPLLKGKIIHKLLEVLPKVDCRNWDEISDSIINNPSWNSSLAIREEAKKTAIGLLTNTSFKEFFRENSKAEVPIVGEVDGFTVSGKIDRLSEFDDKILILDYKNTIKYYKNPENLPIEYKKQLELYKKLLEQLKPEKAIECYILLTNYGELLRIL
ncbi:MAG: double-strand break repair helicase AddA [Rickettsiales bacterium]|jgi:ATP-dependent helicase/nuclease subunit A|nr:double-strand break repair helicase AddA [Rickettsiales bacterium]